jgi:polysaccharide export outer membrane protein
MKTSLDSTTVLGGGNASPRSRTSRRLLLALFTLATGLLVGCSSSLSTRGSPPAPATEAQILRAGDVVKITFPRTPSLDTTQQIRRDGRINLHLIGEIIAADRTPTALESELIERYESQLVAREVRVTVVSSAFSVFVTGAVLRPGKLTPERTLTAFEAIMEAGGFDATKADTKAVTVIRNEGGITKNFTLNLKAVLEGRKNQPFYLQAYDIVYVPERFSWF